MSRAILAGVVCAALAILAPLQVCAQVQVPLGGYELFPIRCAAGGYTAEQRADIIARRAAELLELNNPNALNIRITRIGNNAAIYAGGTLFATVDPCDARANHTTVMKLARVWANRLQAIYPKALAEKPGVGPSGLGSPQSGAGPSDEPAKPR